MKWSEKVIKTAFVAVLSINILSLSGCGNAEDSQRTETKTQYGIIGETTKEASGQQDHIKGQTAGDIAGPRDKADGVEGGSGEGDSVVRSYSDREKERMEELKQSYQKETIYPEKLIQEANSPEDVIKGTLCYVRSTGEYYLPDRELTDEELLEIIDCNFRIALNASRKTQEEYEAEDLAARAMLEEKVQAAGGIGEEKAIEIAEKAMETDIGDKGNGLKLHRNDAYGWGADLCDITDWDEYKDKGDMGYFVQFDNVEEIEDLEELFLYQCTVNAVDGSICGAYTIEGLGGKTVWYRH